MFFSLKKRFMIMRCLIIISVVTLSALAYNGSETWLHYTAADPEMVGHYQAVCKSLVLADELDTMKNIKYEFDLAIPKLLGGSALAVSDAAGAIVCAPQGSALIPAEISYDNVADEGFIIKSSGGKTYITAKSQVPILYGVFHFLRLMQTGKPITNLNIIENPYFPYRVLDHWYNHYGSNPDTERVYGGNRVYRMERFGSLSDTEKKRIIDYCRMAASTGLNGICPDNVNTYRGGSIRNFTCLEVSNLKTQKIFADLIGTYGLKYYLSVSFGSPKLVNPKISSNDGRDPLVQQWWNNKVDTVRAYIKNFGGLLMKADSEGETGPRDFGAKQSEGANPMAKALQRYGHVLIWRTFIYDTNDPDFARCQSMEFENQTWEPGVILRTKDGPRDFQTVEPPNQVTALPGVRHGMEFQITQEYTGQGIHLCWLVPKWKKILDYDLQVSTLPPGAAGSVTHQLLRGDGKMGTGGGMWGISNYSDTVNWTAQFLAQANSYGFGRLAWNPALTEEEIANEWVRCSFDKGYNFGVRRVVGDILKKSWKTYEDYTISYAALMPALRWNDHYEIDFAGQSQSEWYTPYFMNFKSDGIGVDRTMTTGNKMVEFYSPPLKSLFGTKETCPEEYLLYFHHLPWEYTMKSGMTLIQSLHHNHYRGLHQVRNSINNWKILKEVTGVDDEIYSHVLAKLNHQNNDAKRWAAKFKTDFGAYYSTAIPCDIAIVPPDSSKAVNADVGVPVTLSSYLKDQNGAAVAGTFNWSVDKTTGTLSAATGETVSFTGTENTIYTVRLSNVLFPEMADELQIFVGTWHEEPPVGVRRRVAKLQPVKPVSMIQRANKLLINVPAAGTIEMIRLQGSVVKSERFSNSGVFAWDAHGIARGMYLIHFKNDQYLSNAKFILR